MKQTNSPPRLNLAPWLGKKLTDKVDYHDTKLRKQKPPDFIYKKIYKVEKKMFNIVTEKQESVFSGTLL